MLWVEGFFFHFFSVLHNQLWSEPSCLTGSAQCLVHCRFALSVGTCCSRDITSAEVNPEEYLHNFPCFHCLPSLRDNGGIQDAHTPRTTENGLSQQSFLFCSCPEGKFVRLQHAKKLLKLGFSRFCLTFLTVFLISCSPCQRHQGLNLSKTWNPSLSEY